MKSRKPKIYVSAEQCPQAGRERMIMPQPIEVIGNNARNPEPE